MCEAIETHNTKLAIDKCDMVTLGVDPSELQSL